MIPQEDPPPPMSAWHAFLYALLYVFFLTCFALYHSGCGPSRRPISPKIVFQDGTTKVILSAKEMPSPKIQSQIRASLRRHKNAFQVAFGRPSIPFTLEVLFANTFETPEGVQITGLTKGNTVIVSVGVGNRLPALFHELVHLNAVSSYGADPGHLDHRWSSWTTKSLSL